MPNFIYQSDSEKYRETFQKYVELGHKAVPDALDHQGMQLAFDLYRLTLKYTPGKAFIMAIPPRVGWKIRRPRGYAVFTLTDASPRRKKMYYEKTRVKKDGTTVTKLVPLKPEKIVSKPGEMEERVRGVGVTARSWLPRVWRPGKSGWSLHKVKNPRGRVEWSESGGTYSITLINSYPGMPGMDARFGIVQKALDARAADMQVYIDRKLQEAAHESGMA